jgi:glycopeptide antibiotics resistance protein
MRRSETPGGTAMETRHRKLYIFLFCLYSAFMLYLLFGRSGGIEGKPYWDQIQANLNLKPFHTILLFLNVLTRPAYGTSALFNLGGNVILFIPLGFFLPCVFLRLRKFSSTILTTAAIISTVELLQLFTLLGRCDIDDLILNILGAAIGYGVHKIRK